ncbi:MAG: acyl-CoA thioesterase [Myxococcota bacterium]
MSIEELLSDFPVQVEFPVAWGDMDAFQHVNNTRYFRYFEDARIAYFEQTGLIESVGTPGGIGPILAATSCKFRLPLTYPDTVYVGARCSEIGTDRFEMSHRVVSKAAGRVAAEGTGLVVSFDYDQGQKTTLPSEWIAHIEAIEGKTFSRGE